MRQEFGGGGHSLTVKEPGVGSPGKKYHTVLVKQTVPMQQRCSVSAFGAAMEPGTLCMLQQVAHNGHDLMRMRPGISSEISSFNYIYKLINQVNLRFIVFGIPKRSLKDCNTNEVQSVNVTSR